MEKLVIDNSIMLIGGLVGLNIYGESIFVLLSIMYILLSLVDIFLGTYIAKKNKDVNSKRFIDGVISKGIGYIIIMVIALLVWNVSYISNNMWYSLLALIIPLLLTLGELMSIIENYLLINHNAYENRLMKIILKLLGLGVDEVEKLADKKLKDLITKK